MNKQLGKKPKLELWISVKDVSKCPWSMDIKVLLTASDGIQRAIIQETTRGIQNQQLR